MRKIEQEMLLAIQNRKDWSCANTRVAITYFAHGERIIDRETVYLHNSTIAQITNSEVTISDCGYQTATTKSRLSIILRKLCGAGVYQKAHKWYGCPVGLPEFEIELNESYVFDRI